jgi:hypothetical protein
MLAWDLFLPSKSGQGLVAQAAAAYFNFRNDRDRHSDDHREEESQKM